MRFVAWNLRGATDRKWLTLRALEPDVAVISEAIEAPKALVQHRLGEPELHWEWEGTNPTKGVAIAAWDLPLRRRPTRDASGRWAIGAAIGQLLIIGMWSCPKRGGSGNYAVEIERALDAFGPQIERHHELIIAGDFNLTGRDAAMHRLRQRLAAMGLVSAYHHATGDPFGLESAATFHARHPDEHDQHIDYFWLSESLAQRIVEVRLGAPAESDHSPLIVDLDDA